MARARTSICYICGKPKNVVDVIPICAECKDTWDIKDQEIPTARPTPEIRWPGPTSSRYVPGEDAWADTTG